MKIKRNIYFHCIISILFLSHNAFALPINNWYNLFNITSGYNENNSIILSLKYNNQQLLLGNSSLPGATGKKHIWTLNTNGVWNNISDNWNNYVNSAPTAILPIANNEIVIGHYNGQLQSCISNYCTTLIENQDALGWGITDLIQLNNIYFVAYSDKNNGNNGQLLVYQDHQHMFRINAIHSGVGKIATDNTFIYIPTKDDGVFKISSDGVNVSNITPHFEINEFATIMYYNKKSNTLFLGTNLANVYKVKLPLNNGHDWVKLNKQRLSFSSISSIIVDDQNNLYIGLGDFTAPLIGGGLFILKNSQKDFIQDCNYHDPSSITQLLNINNHIYISTFMGYIWVN